MPGPGTSFVGGPVATGTVPYTLGANLMDMGTASLSQTFTLTQNSTTAVSQALAIPQGAQIIDIITDTTVLWNSATSATLSVGNVAAGTQYASGVDVKTTGLRIRPTYTAAQLTAMSNVGTNGNIVITITPVGATSAGTTIVTIIYDQNVNLTGGPTPP